VGNIGREILDKRWIGVSRHFWLANIRRLASKGLAEGVRSKSPSRIDQLKWDLRHIREDINLLCHLAFIVVILLVVIACR
jgi:hypothetical protein